MTQRRSSTPGTQTWDRSRATRGTRPMSYLLTSTPQRIARSLSGANDSPSTSPPHPCGSAAWIERLQIRYERTARNAMKKPSLVPDDLWEVVEPLGLKEYAFSALTLTL